MKKMNCTKNLCLSVVLALGALSCLAVRAFLPNFILPEFDGVTLVGLSLVALVIAYYLPGGQGKTGIHTLALAAVSFGLLPFAACLVGGLDALKLAAQGGVVFTAVSWIFDSAADRIATGPAAKAAPVVTALGIFLAAQCLMGLI